jgi:hypothetical protein
MTTRDQFREAFGTRPTVHANHARDRAAVLGDHYLPAIPDPCEVATQVVLKLPNSHSVYGHIHDLIIATLVRGYRQQSGLLTGEGTDATVSATASG